MVKSQTILQRLRFDLQFICMVSVLLEHLSGFYSHTNSSQSLKSTDSYIALTSCFRRVLYHTLQYKWKRYSCFISFRYWSFECGYIYRFKSVILLLKKKILSFSIQPFLTTISKTNQKFLGDLNDDCTSLLLVLLEEFSTQLSSLMLKQGKREELLERWKLKSASSSVIWL